MWTIFWSALIYPSKTSYIDLSTGKLIEEPDMGGERTTYVEKKSSEAIGLNKDTYEVHENAGQVHFHDRTNKLKCAVPVATWWKAWNVISSNSLPVNEWVFVDKVNKTMLTITPVFSATKVDVEVQISVFNETGSNFEKLDNFTRKK